MSNTTKERFLENDRGEKFRLLKLCWMMYVLFPFRLNGISTLQNLIYYGLSIVFVCIFFFQLNKRKVEGKYLSKVIGYLFILAIITIFAYVVPIVKNTNDTSYFSYFLYYWGRIIVLTGTLTLCQTVIRYLDLVIDAINLYVMCSIFLLIPSFHNFYAGVISVSSTTSAERLEQLYSQTYYTRFGLQGFSGFGATLMCTISVLLSCYLIVISINKKKSMKPYVFRVVISLIGTALYGRIGFLVSLVLIAMTLLYVAIFYNKYGMLLSICGVGILVIILFVANAQTLRQISSINWMFEGFFNYLDSGKFSTKSSTVLMSMFFHPSSQTILFGDGYYTVMGKYYMSTDIGFLRPLLFFGIFVEFLYYLQILPLLKAIYGRLKNLNASFLVISVTVLLVLFEFKGESLMTVGNMLFVITLAVVLKSRISSQF